jgi:glycosyltransferase involved in cell wall biosynthesis
VGDGDIRNHIESECIKRHFDYVYFPEEKRSAEVIFTSWQTQIDQVLDGLDIVALTSHNEGTPLSLIEAQAAGKPLVSTNVGGVMDVVNPHLRDFVTPAGEEEKFANALLRLVEDENLRKTIGKEGVEFAMSKFSYQRLVKDMSAYYYRLLEDKKRGQ